MKNTIKLFMMILLSAVMLGFPECNPPDADKTVEPSNTSPFWTISPADVQILAGDTYNAENGAASDKDMPNASRRDPGYVSCSAAANSCSFDVEVSGKGNGSVGCSLSFTAVAQEQCSVSIIVSDGRGKSISENINITVLAQLDISDCVPNPINEGGDTSCLVISQSGTPEIDPIIDTCGGVLNGTGPWIYDLITSETDGPGTCNAAVRIVADNSITDSETIDINETNEAPTIDITCPASVFESAPINCAISVSDPDIPANALNCSIAADDTCGGVVTACSSYTLASAAAGCRVSVDVTDNGDPVLTDNDGADVIANPEQVGIFCPVRSNEDVAINCTAAISDGPSNCVIGAADTCGGSIDAGCAGPYSAPAPGENKGPGSCVVEVVKGSASDNNRIIIDEVNNPPVVNPVPSPITRLTKEPFNKLYVHATDMDLPNTLIDDPGDLTCSKASQTCSFNVEVSGTGHGAVDCNIDFTPNSTPEACVVTVQITDGYGGSVTQDINITVNQCIFYVNNAVGGTGGRSWSDSFATLQEGIDAAWESCDIWVAKGTYSSGSSAPAATMKDGVNLFGSFAGTETSFAQRYNIFTNPTILDGANTSTHVVIASSDSELNGFQIIRGNADGGGDDDFGGGVYGAYTENFTMENCVLKNNSAVTGGGGVYLTYSFGSLIYNCLMHNNSAYYGPALYGYVVDNEIYLSTFTDNTGASGGGLYYDYAQNYIAYSIVTNCDNCWEMWGNCAKPPNYWSHYEEYFSAIWTWTIWASGCKDGLYLSYSSSRPWTFAAGTYGNYYAAQPPGQAATSHFVDMSDTASSTLGMNIYTTSTNGDPDISYVDLGFHYPIP